MEYYWADCPVYQQDVSKNNTGAINNNQPGLGLNAFPGRPNSWVSSGNAYFYMINSNPLKSLASVLTGGPLGQLAINLTRTFSCATVLAGWLVIGGARVMAADINYTDPLGSF